MSKHSLSWLDEYDNQHPNQIDSYYVKAQKAVEKILYKNFYLDNLPNVWPLDLYQMVYHLLPEHLQQNLKSIQLNYIPKYKVHASASPKRKILITTGLSDFFFNLSYALIPDKREYYAEGASFPQRALDLAKTIQHHAENIIFAPTERVYRNHFEELTRIRTELARFFPYYRPYIERYAMGCANSLAIFAWFHEISHILLNHRSSTVKAVQNEYEADSKVIEIYFKLRHQTEEFGTPHHICLAPLITSFLEFNSRLDGHRFLNIDWMYDFDTHPALHSRRKNIFQTIINLDKKHQYLQSEIIKITLYSAFNLHIELSNMLLKRGLDPLTSFFTEEEVAYFEVENPGMWCPAFYFAHPEVQGIEYRPFVPTWSY